MIPVRIAKTLSLKRLFIFVILSIVIFVFTRKAGKFEHRVLINLPPNFESTAAEKLCPGYFELKQVDFKDSKLRESLCYNRPAYSLKSNGEYEICEMRPDNPLIILTNSSANKTFARDVFNNSRQIVIYGSKNDLITSTLEKYHSWKGGLIKQTISMAKMLPTDSVTFLDIGCNIGTYSLQARAAGLPVLAVDGNIRSIARVQLAAEEMKLNERRDLKLFWAVISEKVGLQRIDFHSKDCNVGGGTFSDGIEQSSKTGIRIWDKIPVPSASADDLLPFIRTRNIIIKIDIEMKESEFIKTAGSLFDQRFIAVVQSEMHFSCPGCISKDEFLFQFFKTRNYTMYDADFEKISSLKGFYKIDTFIDCYWIHNTVAANMMTIETD